jgi:predicted amidohydrolase
MPPGYPEPMASSLRVACVQLNATESKAHNIELAEALVAQAAATGADLVLLPEKWNGFGRPDFMRSIAESLDDGETFAAMSDWARAHGITLVGGSIGRRPARSKAGRWV